MSKSTSQRNERILNELRSQEAYKECADCGSSRPGWASWNLGITLCVACAQIHRALGTDISKVKSLSLDVWTKEQVDSMKATGNIKSNARFNPDLRAHPPPTDLEGSDRNSQMQRYITKKYRDKAFVARKPSPEPARKHHAQSSPSARSVRFQSSPSSRSTRSPSPEARLPDLRPSSSIPKQAPVSILRSRTAPLPEVARAPTPVGLAANNPFNRQMTASAQIPSHSYTLPPNLPTTSSTWMPANTATSNFAGQATYSPVLSQGSSFGYHPPGPSVSVQPKGGVWDDLAGLSLSSASSAVPHTWATQQYAPSPAASQSSNPFLRTTSPCQPQSIASNTPYTSLYQPQLLPQSSFVPQSIPSGYPQQNAMQNFPSTNPFSTQINHQSSFNTFAQTPQNPFAGQTSQQYQYQYAQSQPAFQYQQNFG